MGEIRSITLEDLPAYRETLDTVARERRYLHMLEAPPLERLMEFVRKGLEKNNIHLVAAVGLAIAGWCDITRGINGEVHVGHLGMGVHPDFRGQGIGQKLMESALAQARTLGLEKIELQVFTANVPAMKLYKKLGFIEEGLRKRSRCVNGVYDDIMLLALFLR